MKAGDRMSTLVFLDCETTGLDPERHEIWEIAWAVDDGPIRQHFALHSLIGSDPKALEIGRYNRRWTGHYFPGLDDTLQRVLYGATVVGSNPAFDTAMLRARWGYAPWHHRLLDVATYAMPAMGVDRPQGLAAVADFLGIDAPDHTAAGDVRTLRACWSALTDLYGRGASA